VQTSVFLERSFGDIAVWFINKRISMSILDSLVSAVEGTNGDGSDTARVTGGLVSEIQQHPGGVGGLFQAFQEKGMGGLVQQWAGGQTQPASPDQIDQGLGHTGIIGSLSQKTGLSPTAVKAGLAIAVPVLIHHFVANGHVTADGQPTGLPAPDSSSLLQSVLGKIL
jgi:uncharacterized protein YidB (DUF937 family)